MISDSPNVVWLTLESVRADHTPMGGYDRDTTPAIRQLAEEDDATAFENCFAHSMWTPASSASIFTGTYLSDHGVGKDGSGMRTLPPNLTTLPALLADDGYRTACLSPNGYLSSANGLDRGFRDFYWLSKNLADGGVTDLFEYALNLGSHEGSPLNAKTRALVKYALNVRSHGPGFTLDRNEHNLSYVMTEMAKRWVSDAAKGDDPFFLYAHIGNPHHPYCPPRRTRDRFRDSLPVSMDEAIDLSLDVYGGSERIRRLNANGSQLTPEQWDAIETLYDTEITYADDCVREIVNHVREHDDGNTIFVITADHGELFGEYGLVGHNLVLHDALTHVPLVVAGADLDCDGDELVQHVDVTRTIGSILGHDHEQFRGYDLRTETRDYCLSQRGRADFDEFFEINSGFDTELLHEHPVSAIRTREFKYLESASKSNLFELPDEETDVSDEHPEVVETLSGVVDDWVDWTAVETDEAEFSDDMKEQLADLGYL
ncbi:sulfatase [Halorussus salinisoli]|uniref:sulfatase n=1 Tax=Halorussus salinisoli TaxID=2558242 RepID=UPI0010C2309E|nr:sulfatase [Halorussus salinisoli]